MALMDDIRQYWDADAPTYDLSPRHRPQDPVVQAAWTAALERLLPPAPATVLDCGAGTGFLSLMAARLGHRVTALDLSPGMLERLEAAATAEGLTVELVVGPADQPPAGFDAVMERHLLWTLPEPGAALAAWRAAAPDGRLVLLESLWGSVDPAERLRSVVRSAVRRGRRPLGGGEEQPEHHAPYSSAMQEALPLGTGTTPARLIELAVAAGWTTPRLERLADVEWAERQGLPVAERLIGVTPRFAITAGHRTAR